MASPNFVSVKHPSFVSRNSLSIIPPREISSSPAVKTDVLFLSSFLLKRPFSTQSIP